MLSGFNKIIFFNSGPYIVKRPPPRFFLPITSVIKSDNVEFNKANINSFEYFFFKTAIKNVSPTTKLPPSMKKCLSPQNLLETISGIRYEISFFVVFFIDLLSFLISILIEFTSLTDDKYG